tara:strand:+ start:58226 stop:59299 length:1074 start_codon:yes stop_codon:yes gene_type:complete
VVALIIKKLLYGFSILFGVLTIVFFLFKILPADPARMMLDKREDAEQLELINQKYGFDKPVYLQYLSYVNDISLISIYSLNKNSFFSIYNKEINFFKLFSTNFYVFVVKLPDFGKSFLNQEKSVVSIIISTFKNTLVLAVSSITIAIFLGLLMGVFSAINKDNIIDKSILFFSAIGMSLPSFFSAILIAWLFGFVLHQYTNLQMTGSLFEIDDYGMGYHLNLKNLILPSITLGIRPLAVIIQLSRNSLLDVLNMDYIRTAKAKGVKYSKVLFRHALRNSLNPVVTAVSGWFASLLAGAVFVEYVFGWNGLGKEIVNALNTMDLPVIMGSVLFIATVFIIINLLVDLIYTCLDPRIKK